MQHRKLATIVFSDAVEYSRLVHEREEAALSLIERDFALMRRIAEQHGGEVVKSTGDGLLFLYDSAVAGTQATLQMLRELSVRSPEQHLISHRFGIHLGDVMRVKDDVVGDGVNIAARLQSEAPKGGIALSRTVYDVVSGKTHIPAVRIGETQLRNITKPVEMWHVMPDALLSWGGPPETVAREREAKTPTLVWGVVAVVFLVVVGILLVQGGRAGAPGGAATSSKSTTQALPEPVLKLGTVGRGAMLTGPSTGRPSLDIWISKESTIQEGVQPYRLNLQAVQPDGTPVEYEVSAMVAFFRAKDELIQIPLSEVRDLGIPEGTQGVVVLEVDGKTAQTSLRL